MLTSTQASHLGPTVVGTPGTIPHLSFHFAWLFGCWFIKFWVWPSSVSPCNSPRILLQTLRSTSRLPLGPHYSRPTLHPGLALQVPTFAGPLLSCLSTLRATHSELGSAKAMLSKASHPLLRLQLLPGAASPTVWVQELPWGSSPRPELITLEGNHLSTCHHPTGGWRVLQGTEDNRG